MGFDSHIPLVLMAVSIFHYRRRELLECQTMDKVNLFLVGGFKQVCTGVLWLANFFYCKASIAKLKKSTLDIVKGIISRFGQFQRK